MMHFYHNNQEYKMMRLNYLNIDINRNSNKDSEIVFQI
jgi:hypothetical protein